MTVQAKLRLAGTTVAAMAIFLGVLFLITGEPALRGVEVSRLATRFQKGVFELSVVQSDYVREPSARAEAQWQERYISLATLFDEPVRWSGDELILLESLRSDYDALGLLFGQLVSSGQEEGIELRRRVTGQLLVRSQSLVDTSFSLAESTQIRIEHSVATARPMVIVIVMLLIMFGFGLNILFRRSIVAPLLALTKAADQVQSGASNVVVPKSVQERRDELGTLAKALANMVANLRASYTGLEVKVQQRTQELDSKVYELERVQQASMNIMKDLREEKSRLAEAKARDDAILASMGEGLVVTDENQRVLMMNDAAEKMLLWEEKEVRGLEWKTVMKAQDEQGNLVVDETLPVVKALQGVEVNHTTRADSYFYTRRDGIRFPVAVTSSRLEIDGRLLGSVVVFRDITQEQAIDKAKTEFVSLASHQLRTPLSTINWYAEMLQAGDAGELEPDQKKYVEEIYKGNQRMVDLVNALLDVSRIDLGTFSVDPEPTNIVELAQSVIQELEPQIFKKKQLVNEEYDPALPTMNVDPKLVRILFQNLLSNSVKYTPEKGTVTLSVTVDGKDLLIAVADTGMGIPKKQQDKIFTKLFRADNVKDADTTGTGLGLYLLKAIVDYSGGSVRFESEEGKGTTFLIRLPLSGMEAKTGSRELGE